MFSNYFPSLTIAILFCPEQIRKEKIEIYQETSYLGEQDCGD